MRLTSFWTTATTDPTTMVSTASTQIRGRQLSTCDGNADSRMRNSAAKPAVLATAAMNPVAGVGAPWYTSGVHHWNGTAATLNPRPTMRKAVPARSTAFDGRTWLARNVEMPASEVVPVAPYTRAIP